MKKVDTKTVLYQCEINRYHYAIIFFSSVVGFQALYAGNKIMKARIATFGRNNAVIEEKFGSIHRESFGPESKISYYGYPDMGNNLYADLLPYADWFKMNNAIRMHEHLLDQITTLYVTTFLSSLWYPRYTLAIIAIYASLRFFHIKAYTSQRGINKAKGAGDALKMLCFLMSVGAGISSLRILGVTAWLARINPVALYRARKLRKAAS